MLTSLHASLPFEERINALKEMIENSKKTVFFGGAGVSTESGIPDFRSKDGLYNQHDVQFEKYSPEYLLSHSCLYNKPKVFYEFYRQKLDCKDIEPNITHKKLAELEQTGKLAAVITQNIDGLHQKAGSKNVLEIHGTTLRNYCSVCGKEYDADYIFNCIDSIPKCTEPGCKGMIRPDVVLYEESLSNVFNKAYDELKDTDLLIVGGTSLTVQPAAGLISYYFGKNLVIINRDKTDYDAWADIVFHESLGEVFERL